MKGTLAVIGFFALATLSSCVDHNPTRPSRRSEAPPPTGTLASPELTGVVRDAVSQQPIADANVQWAGVAEALGDRGHGVFTDATGAYRLQIRGLPTGWAFSLRATKEGYNTVEILMSLPITTPVDFALTRSTTGF